jgi:hypothetical protein
MDMMANGQEVRRRRYSEERKQQVLSECKVALQPMDMRAGALRIPVCQGPAYAHQAVGA